MFFMFMNDTRSSPLLSLLMFTCFSTRKLTSTYTFNTFRLYDFHTRYSCPQERLYKYYVTNIWVAVTQNLSTRYESKVYREYPFNYVTRKR